MLFHPPYYPPHSLFAIASLFTPSSTIYMVVPSKSVNILFLFSYIQIKVSEFKDYQQFHEWWVALVPSMSVIFFFIQTKNLDR